MAGCRRWTSAAEGLPPSALTSRLVQSKRAAIGASKIRLPPSEPMMGTTHDGCLGATVEAASVSEGTPKASSDKAQPIPGCARRVVETKGTVDGLRDSRGRHNRLQCKWSSPCKAHPATAPAGSSRRPTATEHSGQRSNWRAKGRSNKSVARDARSDPERCRSHDRARQTRAFDKVRWLNIRSSNRLDHLEPKYWRGSRFGMNPDQKSQ
jgi:hypothetical protein